MDIDSELIAYNFNSKFPLQFRILILIFITILSFSINLHFLYFIGLDTSKILDIKFENYRLNNNNNHNNDNSYLPITTTNINDRIIITTTTNFVHPSKLFPPIYKISILGLIWSLLGWILFNFLTSSNSELETIKKLKKFKNLPNFFSLIILFFIIVPWNILYKRERFRFLRALKRIIFSPLYSTVPFCDIILADILTSSAKVLGDIGVSICLILSFNSTTESNIISNNIPSGCAKNWMIPFMTSLPYIFRFRQCLSEVVTSSTPTPSKSMLNALKYFTAFPVILFSALQTVTGEEEEIISTRNWLSKDLIFSLWVISVLINSLYSFWWDVTNDWGLSLLTPTGWSSSPSISYAFIQPSTTRTSRSLSRPSTSSSSTQRSGSRTISNSIMNSINLSANDFQIAPGSSRPQTPESRSSISLKPSSSSSSSSFNSSSLSSSSSSSSSSSLLKAYSTSTSPNITYPFLRPILLLPDPYIYYLFILLDLILRFTWSLKLSSHLHSLQEIESGIFLMEALEIFRRWIWVFLRIEWEAIRKGTGGGGGGGMNSSGESRERTEDDELEMGGMNDNMMGGGGGGGGNIYNHRESESNSSHGGGGGSRNNSSSQKGGMGMGMGGGSGYDINGLNRSGSGNNKASLGEIGLGIIGE